MPKIRPSYGRVTSKRVWILEAEIQGLKSRLDTIDRIFDVMLGINAPTVLKQERRKHDRPGYVETLEHEMKDLVNDDSGDQYEENV